MAQPLPDQGQYAQMYEALVSKYPALEQEADGKQKAFQFSAGPIQAAWSLGSDYEAYRTANTVSQHLGGYYAANAGSLTSAYRDLIHSIAPAELRNNPNWVQLMGERDDLRKERRAKEDQMQVAYRTYTQQTKNPQTSTEWLADVMGGAGYNEELTEIKQAISELDKRIQGVVAAMDGALADAQAALDDEDFQQNYKAPDGGMVKRPRINIAGDLGDDKARWNRYGDHDYDFQATLQGRADVKTPWRTVYDTKVEHHCLTTSVSTEVNTSRIIADEQYKIEMSFKGLAAYEVQFGEWYHASYVDPNTAQFPEGGTVNADTFFGPDGTLHMTPELIFVAYRPRFVITVSTQLFRQQFNEEAIAKIDWLDLFGFRFDIDGLASLKPEGDDQTTTITIDAPATQHPTILGVMSSVHYNGTE